MSINRSVFLKKTPIKKMPLTNWVKEGQEKLGELKGMLPEAPKKGEEPDDLYETLATLVKGIELFVKTKHEKQWCEHLEHIISVVDLLYEWVDNDEEEDDDYEEDEFEEPKFKEPEAKKQKISKEIPDKMEYEEPPTPMMVPKNAQIAFGSVFNKN